MIMILATVYNACLWVPQLCGTARTSFAVTIRLAGPEIDVQPWGFGWSYQTAQFTRGDETEQWTIGRIICEKPIDQPRNIPNPGGFGA